MNAEIPNYSLLSRLGQGAMAEVWLAEHRINRRKAAIKLFLRPLPDERDADALFIRESEVLAGFRDENIVSIYDSGRAGDVAYIVMEHLSGGTLLDRMQRGPISVGEAIALVAQVAKGLGPAHRASIVHRDLKPSNIMFREDTTPVITDFGAARMLGRSTIYGKDGGIVGTPYYMSPEQLQGKPLDGRSDLYALGVIFHELLTGELPYRGASVTEVASQHVLAPVPKLPAEVGMLQPILERLMAKDPGDRFASADEFIAALRDCFLQDEELRRQVGFAATSAAWSSQLRALGFVLDAGQKADVRVAQGDFLKVAATTAAQPLPPARNQSALSPRPWRRWLPMLLLVGAVVAVVAWMALHRDTEPPDPSPSPPPPVIEEPTNCEPACSSVTVSVGDNRQAAEDFVRAAISRARRYLPVGGEAPTPRTSTFGFDLGTIANALAREMPTPPEGISKGRFDQRFDDALAWALVNAVRDTDAARTTITASAGQPYGGIPVAVVLKREDGEKLLVFELQDVNIGDGKVSWELHDLIVDGDSFVDAYRRNLRSDSAATSSSKD